MNYSKEEGSFWKRVRLTEYDIIPLNDPLSMMSPEHLAGMLSSFSCKKDKDVERFLHETAVMYEKRHLARTYLIFEVGSYKEPVAYFSIAVSSMDTGKMECADALRKKMNIYNDTAQSYLIGQLGKRDGAPKGLGEFAISCAMALITDANKRVGCRVIRLDCRKPLINYYAKKGFVVIGHDEEKDLYQMVRILV